MSLVSINCVNNIECYWSRSHSLSATHCLHWVLSDPVADPECAREGGVSHILSEKGLLASLYSKKCMTMQYFHQSGGGGAYAGYALCWIRHWDLFLGQCHQLPLLLPLGLHLNHLKPLSATVVALIRFISHLKIKIFKLLSLKLQNKQIIIVFFQLKLWVKVVRHNSKSVRI